MLAGDFNSKVGRLGPKAVSGNGQEADEISRMIKTW